MQQSEKTVDVDLVTVRFLVAFLSQLDLPPDSVALARFGSSHAASVSQSLSMSRALTHGPSSAFHLLAAPAAVSASVSGSSRVNVKHEAVKTEKGRPLGLLGLGLEADAEDRDNDAHMAPADLSTSFSSLSPAASLDAGTRVHESIVRWLLSPSFSLNVVAPARQTEAVMYRHTQWFIAALCSLAHASPPDLSGSCPCVFHLSHSVVS